MKGSVVRYKTKKSKRGYMWMYVVDLGRDPATGKRRQKRKRGFLRKEDAEMALAELLSQYSRGEYVEPAKLTLSQFIYEWLETKQPNLKEATYLTYKNHIDHHIVPYIGQLRLSELTPKHIADLHANLYKKDLSGTTVQDVHKVLRNALGTAVKWGWLQRNVATMVDRPKANRRKPQIWTIDEVNRFLEVARRNTRYHIAFLLALATGMRQGEILGLRWKDVDFDEGLITVIQTLDHQGKKIQDETKTKTSQRTITVDKTTLAALKAHKAKVAKEKLVAGKSYQDHGLVVCTEIGTPVSPRNLLRVFTNTIKKAGVPKITFHELRHTHASILLQQGVNIKAIQERLGHKDVKLTLETYSHLLPNIQKETAKKLEGIFNLPQL